MAVYVDRLRACIPTENWPWNFGCHLIADDQMELHAFAKKLWLRREWYQTNAVLPHYDLTARKRGQAIRLGAIEISDGEVSKRYWKARKERESERGT